MNNAMDYVDTADDVFKEVFSEDAIHQAAQRKLEQVERELKEATNNLQRMPTQAAQRKLEQKQKEATNSEIKSDIIQLLIQSKIDLAAEKYEKAKESLSKANKKEISIYAHQIMDADLIPALFQGLPPPFSPEEFIEKTEGGNVTIGTADLYTKNIQKAKKELDQTLANFTKMGGQNNKRLKGCTSVIAADNVSKEVSLREHFQFNCNNPGASNSMDTDESAAVMKNDRDELENIKDESCYSATLGELRHCHRIGRDPLECFHTFLRSPKLSEFAGKCGIEMDKYELPNTWITREQNECSRKGEGSGGSDTVNCRFEALLNDKNLSDSRTLTIVFHGSDSSNISNILENGLDPGRRRGQALGQGEYFAIDPSICLRYCHGGKAMVVFLVLVPEQNLGQRPMRRRRMSTLGLPEQNLGQRPMRRRRMSALGWQTRCIVVKETNHQFPIGVLRFKSYTKKAGNQSNRMMKNIQAEQRMLIQAAQRKLEQEQKEATNAEMKSDIIQLMIQSMIDLAAEKYEKAKESLSDDNKKEISIYAHQIMDADLIPALFQGLPPPFSPEEFIEKTEGDNATIGTADLYTKNIQKAKKELEQTQANCGLKKAPLSFAALPEPMKSSKGAIAIASLSGKFLDGNDLFCKISELGRKELCYKTFYNLTNHLDLDLISEILSAASGDAAQTFWVLRGNFEHREDVGMAVTLIKDEKQLNISKCFAVTLIQNPKRKNDRFSPTTPATLGNPSRTLNLLNPFNRPSTGSKMLSA